MVWDASLSNGGSKMFMFINTSLEVTEVKSSLV